PVEVPPRAGELPEGGIREVGEGRAQGFGPGDEIGVEDQQVLAGGSLQAGLESSGLVAVAVAPRPVRDVVSLPPVRLDRAPRDVARLVGRVVEDLDLHELPGVIRSGEGGDDPLDDVDFVVDRKRRGAAGKFRELAHRAGDVPPVAVVETDHHRAVRPIHREEGQNGVVGGERRDLRGLIRHLSNRWLLLAAAELVAVGFLLAPDARNHLEAYFLLFLAAAGISLRAARILTPSSRAFVLGCAALLRATLLLRAPDLSDDVRRYLWDGRIASKGISPYAFAPDDPRVSAFAPRIHGRLGHRD